MTDIGNTSAQAIISVIGTDMGRFPADIHISSWPDYALVIMKAPRRGSPKRPQKGTIFRGPPLITCAYAAVRNKRSYFHAQFMRISSHRENKRAYVAVAHSMLIAIYHILKDGVVFRDLGATYCNQFNKERKINTYLKKLKALGWEAPVVAT